MTYPPTHNPERPFTLGEMGSQPPSHPTPRPPQRGPGLKFVLIGAAVVLLAGGAVAVGLAVRSANSAGGDSVSVVGRGTPDPGEGQAGKAVRIGDTIEYNQLGDRVRVTVTQPQQHAKSPDGTWEPRNGLFLTVSVEFRVVEGSTFACACDFAFVAADGTVYESDLAIGFKTMDGADLRKGQRAAGLVAFDVPKAALTGAKIELREGLDDEAVAHWAL